MMLAVVDASAFAEYLLGTRLGVKVAASLEAPDVELHTPALCDVEVTSAFRGLLRAAKLKLSRALDAIDDYSKLPVTRHGHLVHLERVLALRQNFSAYDATYVALAEHLSARLLTCDAALARGVASHLPRLELIAVV